MCDMQYENKIKEKTIEPKHSNSVYNVWSVYERHLAPMTIPLNSWATNLLLTDMLVTMINGSKAIPSNLYIIECVHKWLVYTIYSYVLTNYVEWHWYAVTHSFLHKYMVHVFV